MDTNSTNNPLEALRLTAERIEARLERDGKTAGYSLSFDKRVTAFSKVLFPPATQRDNGNDTSIPAGLRAAFPHFTESDQEAILGLYHYALEHGELPPLPPQEQVEVRLLEGLFEAPSDNQRRPFGRRKAPKGASHSVPPVPTAPRPSPFAELGIAL